MVHPYKKDMLPIVQNKLGLLFELAVLIEKIDLNAFSDIFVSSRISHYFENGDPVFILGKSSNELLAILLNKEPNDVILNDSYSPEYWVGYVLARASWEYNISFKVLFEKCPPKELIDYYFPYHEMDITKTMELIKDKLGIKNRLKELRMQKNLSQSELAIISDVPIRNIRAYEQGTIDISNAQASTLFSIAKALKCSIEDLI